jgi:hypothetical protein
VGLFDTLNFGYNNLIHLSNFLPNIKIVRQKFVNDDYFQSKAIGSAMDVFLLDDDGKMYQTTLGFDFSKERKPMKEFYDWTGELVFYTSYTVKIEYWVDFFLDVKNGCFDIKKTTVKKNKMF